MVEVTFSSWSAEPIENDRNTYVITHGYLSSSSEEWIDDLAQEIDDRDPFANIILTDWSEAANTLNYFSAVEETEVVGVLPRHVDVVHIGADRRIESRDRFRVTNAADVIGVGRAQAGIVRTG